MGAILPGQCKPAPVDRDRSHPEAQPMIAPPRFALLSLLSILVATSAPADEPPDATARELLAAHDKEREAEKLPPLTLDDQLTEAARLHAEDMAQRQEMTHEGADGSTSADRVKRAGYRYVKTGENVARGQGTVAEVVQAWMESEGHRENILGDFTQMGGAVARDEDGETYWCVEFGTPRIRLDPDTAEKGVVEQIAAIRKEADKGELKADEKLAKAARSLAVQAAENAAKPEAERKPLDVAAALKDAGSTFRDVAVLIGGGNPTPEDFVKSLIDDEEHKKSLLGDHDAVGIGYATDAEFNPFWCVLLVER
jgi:uncharacterized protein YkwD